MDFNLPLVRVPSETDVTIEPGTYELRAAAPGLALPFNAILNVDTTPHPLRTAILLLQAGGSAVVAPTFVPAHGAAQLLSFSTGRIDTVFEDREHEAPFPAGEFIAVATPKPGIVAGVTDVLRLAPGAVAAATAIRLPTKGTGNLILGARFGAENVDAGADISALWLTSAADQSKHAPKAMTGKGRSAFHAVFYDLPPGSYVAHLTSRRWRIDATPIIVHRDATTLDDQHILTLAPKLAIHFDTAPSLTDHHRTATTYRCPQASLTANSGWPLLNECTAIATASGTEPQLLFEGLDPGWLFVRGEVDDHVAGGTIQLADDHDAALHLTFRPVHVLGMVSRGGNPVRAQLEFHHLESETFQAQAMTNDDGKYSLDLWIVGGYKVNLHSPEPSSPSVRRLVSVTETPEQQLDFDLPDTIVRLRVTDTDSAQPVADAEVAFQGQEQMTDATGLVETQGVSPGPLRVYARAAKFAPRQDAFTVAETTEPQTFEIALKRLREELTFTVVLPTGVPASHALGFVGGQGDPINATGDAFTCDTDGSCKLPYRPPAGAVLFLYDPAAAITGTPADAALDTGQVTLRPIGGPTDIILTQGSDASIRNVLGTATVDGVTIPSGILRMFGNREITNATSGSRLSYRTLPIGRLVVNLYALTQDGSGIGLRPIGLPLESSNAAPTTLASQLP